MIVEGLAKDEIYGIETDAEIIAFTPASNIPDTQPERPGDEGETWAWRALAANGFGDY
jgi:hypothetical protein